jgi:hypothetical protein
VSVVRLSTELLRYCIKRISQTRLNRVNVCQWLIANVADHYLDYVIPDADPADWNAETSFHIDVNKYSEAMEALVA